MSRPRKAMRAFRSRKKPAFTAEQLALAGPAFPWSSDDMRVLGQHNLNCPFYTAFLAENAAWRAAGEPDIADWQRMEAEAAALALAKKNTEREQARLARVEGKS